LIVLAAALTLAGCGQADEQQVLPPPGAGIGPAHQLASLSERVARAERIGALACGDQRRASVAHVELFAHGRVVIVPAGIGVAPPRRRDGAYVRGGACRYPLWTHEPTGLVELGAGGHTLGDLFDVWGEPLSARRLARWRGRVRVYVGGRLRQGDPRAVPLDRHAQVVVQLGEPVLRPNADYAFPEGM